MAPRPSNSCHCSLLLAGNAGPASAPPALRRAELSLFVVVAPPSDKPPPSGTRQTRRPLACVVCCLTASVLYRHPPTLQSSSTPMPPVSSAQAASVNGQCLVRPTVSHVNGRGRPSWSADPAAYHLPRLPQAGDGRLANACERHLRRAPIHPGRQASIAPSVSAAAHPTPCQSRP